MGLVTAATRASYARAKVMLLAGDGARITGDMADEMLLDAAREIATIGTGPYRNTLTPTASTSSRNVDLKNALNYDVLWVLYVKWDGDRLEPKDSIEELDEWRRVNGTTLSGDPVYYAVNDKHSPTTLTFDRTPSSVKTLEVVYARQVSAFTDLPEVWDIHAINHARAEVCAIQEKDATLWESRYERFAKRLAKKLRRRHSELLYKPVRNEWLTEGL